MTRLREDLKTLRGVLNVASVEAIRTGRTHFVRLTSWNAKVWSASPDVQPPTSEVHYRVAPDRSIAIHRDTSASAHTYVKPTDEELAM